MGIKICKDCEVEHESYRSTCPPCTNKRQRERYAALSPEDKAKVRAKMREYNKERLEAHPEIREERRAKQQAYIANNKEKHLARSRISNQKYRNKYPDRMRESVRNSRAKRKERDATQ